MTIDFSGFKEEQVLYALWLNAKDAPFFAETNTVNNEVATIEIAREKLSKSKFVDFFCGRQIKISFRNFPLIDGMLYNRDNEPNTVFKVLLQLQNKNMNGNQEHISIAD